MALSLVPHLPDPRGARPAREAVARYYADQNVHIDPDDIILTSSTSEAYAHLFRVLGEPGSTFAAQQPSYPLFEPLAQAEAVGIEPLRFAYDGSWRLDPGSMSTVAPRGVILVQPNHPTGTWLAPGDMAQIEAWCERTDAALISDEVFGDYAWRDGVPGAVSALSRERAVPTVVLSGLSKVCGLPQLKLSWMVVAGPERERRLLVDALEWMADLFLSVNGPVQHALPGLLAARSVFQQAVMERVRGNLRRLRQSVERRPELSMLNADGGWVAVIRAPRVRSEEAWAIELVRRGVVVHPGHFYDIEGGAHLVVSLIVEPTVFDEALGVIEALAAEG